MIDKRVRNFWNRGDVLLTEKKALLKAWTFYM